LLRIVHAADLHLPKNRNEDLHGFKPYPSVKKGIEYLKRLTPGCDLIIFGGDIIRNPGNGDYREVFSLFQEINVPMHAVMGNHDDLQAYSDDPFSEIPQNFQGYYRFQFHGFSCIILNTKVPGEESGFLGSDQVFWMENELGDIPEGKCLIFMHHPPVPCGVPWLDKISLQNKEEFWSRAVRFRNKIRGVFVSHIHMQMTSLYHGIPVASCPSMCCQFSSAGDAYRAAFSSEQPGFNVIDVDEINLRICTCRYETGY